MFETIRAHLISIGFAASGDSDFVSDDHRIRLERLSEASCKIGYVKDDGRVAWRQCERDSHWRSFVTDVLCYNMEHYFNDIDNPESPPGYDEWPSTTV
jgi:hypothetical protein